MEIIRFALAAIFLVAGLFIMVTAVIGMYRFRFVLNRMHAVAAGDTFGLILSMIGLILWKGIGLL